jgi:hypothetical protein
MSILSDAQNCCSTSKYEEKVMYEQNPQVWGIILAGGEGKRLQSFIHSQYDTNAPKQYCTFTGARSMLRHTIDRAEMLVQPESLPTYDPASRPGRVNSPDHGNRPGESEQRTGNQ